MISHKHKFIFIHIPKCAGSSIRDFYFDRPNLNWKIPNYELLYGWCPKRQIHLQHATTRQLLETELITQEDWNSYFKFTFVRNPWDRAYSSYLWVMKDRKISGSFKNFILGKGIFKNALTEGSDMYNRACHKWKQTDFFSRKGDYELDFIGRFENLQDDIEHINSVLGIEKKFDNHSNKSKNRVNHYSFVYNRQNRDLISNFYREDIEGLGYTFDNKRNRFLKITNTFLSGT